MKDRKPLYVNKFVSLYQTDHNFIYAERKNVNSTASLCFKKEKGKFFFLIRMQPLPLVNSVFRKAWNELFPCPITGSLEKKQTPLQNAIQEIYEEANVKVTKKNLKCCVFNVATTQMNESVYNFLFDVTGCKTVNKKLGDGTVFENHSRNKWITYSDLKKIIFNKKEKIYLSSLMTCFQMFEAKYGKTKN